MTDPSLKVRRLLSAVVVVQGAALAAVGLFVASVNLPRAPQRIGHEVVLALGLVVVVLGLLSRWLPVRATMAFGSSVLAAMIVFGVGYRPLRRGDMVLTLADGRVSYRTYESEKEWADRYGRTDLRLGRSGIPNAVARHVNRDFTVTYHLDGEGWRRLPTPAPGTAAGDVWFLGCSYTFGVGVEDDEVYVHRLAATWPHLQLRNVSVPAWGTSNAYLALEGQLAQRPAPRAVVYGWIDDHRQRNYLRRSWFARTNAALIPHFEVDGDRLRWLGMAPNSAADADDGPALDAAETRVSEALIRGMARLTEQRGVPFVLLVLQGGNAIALDRLREEPGLHVLDVSKVSDAYHPHDGHPTRTWHEAVARAIGADPVMAALTGRRGRE